MRFYANKFPEVGSASRATAKVASVGADSSFPPRAKVDQLVMVQVKQIAEMGAYVKLVGWPQITLSYYLRAHRLLLYSSSTTTSRE